jgi:hypothetical protein
MDPIPTDILSKTTFTRQELFDMLDTYGTKFPSFKYCQEQRENSEEDKSYYYGLMSRRYNGQKQFYDSRYSRIEKICQVGGLLIGQNITLTLKGFMGYNKNKEGKVESVNEKKQSITLGRREYTDFESVSFVGTLGEMDKLLIVELEKLIKKLDSCKILILIGRGIVLLEEMLSLVKSLPPEYGEKTISVKIAVPIIEEIKIKNTKKKVLRKKTGYELKTVEIKIKDSLTALLKEQESLYRQYESLDRNMNYPTIFSYIPLTQLNSIRKSITSIKPELAEENHTIVDVFSKDLTDIETRIKALNDKHNPAIDTIQPGMQGGRLFTRKNTKKNRKIRRNKTSSKIN